MDFASALRAVRTRAPLVQCITNFVTVNDCANILLAAGASPTMAHNIREVEESVAGVQALVLNMGAIEDADAMVLAGKRANALGIPVVLDPVAAVSVGVIDGVPCLDLPYPEDSRADVDMNVVMTAEGKFVEIQGTGEHAEFSRSELNELLDLAEGGLYDLVDLQRAALDAELGEAVTLGEWN